MNCLFEAFNLEVGNNMPAIDYRKLVSEEII